MNYNGLEVVSKGPGGPRNEPLSPSEAQDRANPVAANAVDPNLIFSALFEGRRTSHGWSQGTNIGTAKVEVTAAQYRGHLESDGTDGAWSLGLNPLRDDNTLLFAALDFDAKAMPDEEVRGILTQAAGFNLPLMWTRSRSGGLHGWLFMAEATAPVPIQRAMTTMGELLGWQVRQGGQSKGRGDRFFEVFPKQHELSSGECGNWIRLPWPGGESALGRRGLWLRASDPSFTDWVLEALRHRVTLSELESALRVAAPSQVEESVARGPKQVNTDSATPPAGADRVLDPRFPVVSVPSLLAALPEDDAIDRDRWLRTGMALHHEYADTPDEGEALTAYDAWSALAGSPAYQGVEDIRATWQSFKRDRDTRIRPVTMASLFGRARSNGWVAPDVATAIGEFNRRWALVLHGGNAVLETPPQGEPRFHELQRWRTFQGNVQVTLPGKSTSKSLADVWLKAPARRSYNSVVFDPNRPPLAGVPSRSGSPAEQDFNLWPGLALEPSDQGSCELFLDHLLNVVCRGDIDLFQWVLMWLAHIVQHPTRLAGTALALRGAQGAGKSLVGEVMGTILGSSLHAKVSRPDELTGRFNAHQKGRLLLQVEEGFWAGDKKAEGALKHMITSDTIRIEPKFVDSFEIPNYGRLLVTSNKDWVVPAGLGERRFAVLDVSDARANDLVYFTALRRELFENGGAARFLGLLLNEVDVDFSAIRRPPATAALLEQQLESLDLEDRWLMDLLAAGELPGDMDGSGKVVKAVLFGDFQRFMRDAGRAMRRSEVSFGKQLNKRLGTTIQSERLTRPNSSRKRPWIYRFAPLRECRLAFAAHLALSPEWPEVDDWQTPDAIDGLALVS